MPAGEVLEFTVQNIDDRGDSVGEPLLLDQKKLAATLRLSHALCYFSSQSRTIVGGLRLSQTGSPRFSLRHLIVGLGRAPEGCVVEVE